MKSPIRLTIPAGSYRIWQNTHTILQVYLGTCVGLAMYCTTTGVGGIIHILLPEVISSTGTGQPEKYASTGIPLFINALLDAGAQPNSLKACIAGGALVGPLTQQDLELDIGGRTVEVTREILKNHGFDIERSETGGFFTCCLELDMSNGRFDIQPAGQIKSAVSKDIETPNPKAIIKSLDYIKPVPQVALKVLRMTDEPDYDIHKVTHEIRQDQVISARVMKLANSVMFAIRHPIDSLDHALVFLGQEMLIKIILSAAVYDFYNQSAIGYSLCKGGLFHHAIGCAGTAEALARRTRKVEPSIAYTAGLLHDIGKVVLDQYVGSTYPLFYRNIIDEKHSALDTERKLFGIDHTRIGHLLATRWSFPPSLINVIRHHHNPEGTKGHSTLGQIVYLADLLMSRFNIGLELERIDTQTLENNLAALDLEGNQMADLVDLIPMVVFQTSDPSEASEEQPHNTDIS